MSHPCIDCGKEVKTKRYIRCRSCGVKRGKITRPLEQRFWEKVDKDGPIMPHMTTPCWGWTSAKTKRGYGYFTTKRGESKRTHRVSFEFTYGVIPQGMQVLHHCDNPNCVNPEHLFLGTNSDNVADKVKKGRAARLKGEENPAAKITQSQADEIKARYAQGGISQRKLAKEYNVTQRAIWFIVHNLHWS
jgi:hypothetical protein